MATCSDCKFWKRGWRMPYAAGSDWNTEIDSAVVYGRCQIRPATYSPENDPGAGWPQTHQHDWCGEHQPQEAGS